MNITAANTVPAHKLAAGVIRTQRLLDRDYPPGANKPTVAYMDALAAALEDFKVDPSQPHTLAAVNATELEGGVLRGLWRSAGVGPKQLKALSMEFSPFVAMYGKAFPKATLAAAGVK